MKKLFNKLKIYIIKFFKYLTKDEIKPYEDLIKSYFKNIGEKAMKKELFRKKYSNSPKKETNIGLKILVAFASFFIALISFPLIFIFGPFWIIIYFSLSTSILYTFFSNKFED